MPSSFLRSAATGILIAAVLVTVVWVIARLVGDDLRAQTPGAEAEAKLPFYLPAITTIILGTIATGIALLFRRRGWSSRIFYGIAVAFLIVYGVVALGAADATSTGIWLNVMHLVAAAAIVPPLAQGIERAI